MFWLHGDKAHCKATLAYVYEPAWLCTDKRQRIRVGRVPRMLSPLSSVRQLFGIGIDHFDASIAFYLIVYRLQIACSILGQAASVAWGVNENRSGLTSGFGWLLSYS
jgi:hypothetical protein